MRLSKSMTPTRKKTAPMMEHLYTEIKKFIVDDKTQLYNRLHYAPMIYTGEMYSVIIRSGFYPLAVNPNGSFWFNINPVSVDFKTLFVYNDSIAYSYEEFNDYIYTDYSTLGGGTGMTPEIKAYIDTQIVHAEAVMAGNDSITPLPTIAALLSMNTMVDKRLMFVEETNAIYAYDQQSTETVDYDFVLPASMGVGRWKKTSAKVVDGGSW